MGITVQFRGFGTYPRPQLAELPEEHPRANRTGNWQAAQRRAEKSKFVGKRRPKTPPIRYVVSPLPAPSRLLLPPLPHPSSLRPTTTARQASFFVPKNADERHLRACSPSFHFAVLTSKGSGVWGFQHHSTVYSNCSLCVNLPVDDSSFHRPPHCCARLLRVSANIYQSYATNVALGGRHAGTLGCYIYILQ